MHHMSLTLVELNEDKSIDFREEQLRNIWQVVVNNLLNINLTYISICSIFAIL